MTAGPRRVRARGCGADGVAERGCNGEFRMRRRPRREGVKSLLLKKHLLTVGSALNDVIDTSRGDAPCISSHSVGAGWWCVFFSKGTEQSGAFVGFTNALILAVHFGPTSARPYFGPEMKGDSMRKNRSKANS